MEGAAAAAVEASLLDDVVREILVRMKDVADLFRCTVTCKQWRCIVIKASFLRRSRRPDHTTASFLSGFFPWERIFIKDDPTFATCFVPMPRSVFGSDRRFRVIFPKSDKREQQKRLQKRPVAQRGAARDSPWPPPPVRNVHAVSSVQLAVCNLLSGACDKLPPLACGWDFDKSGYAILTSADCSRNAKEQSEATSGYSSFFKVLVIGTHMHRRPHNLYKFTADEPSWSEPSKLNFPAKKERRGYYWPLRHPRAVIWHGTLHWLVHYFTIHKPILHTIEVDARTFHASLTKTDTQVELVEPPNYEAHNYDELQLTRLIVDVDGQLLLLHVQRRGSQLERCTWQEDDGPTRWLRTQVIDLQPPRKTCLTLLEEKDGMLLVKDNHGNVYTIDIETGAMKKFTDFDKINRRTVVAHEMDWPAFFVSRLGAHEPHSNKPSS